MEENIFPVVLFTTVALLILFCATLIVIISAYRERSRQNSNLASAQIYYQQELRLVASEVQEHLAAHLSEDLHSNIGQRLTLIHMQLQELEQRTDSNDQLLKEADANVIETMKQVRQISHSFSSEMIVKQGLISSIRNEATRLQHNGRMRVNFNEQKEINDSSLELTSDQQLVVFRIFQEAVNNALKHSHANNLTISVSSSPIFSLEISDDGIGFDKMQINDRKGAGLSIVAGRAAIASLNCSIESRIGLGTVWRIS